MFLLYSRQPQKIRKFVSRSALPPGWDTYITFMVNLITKSSKCGKQKRCPKNRKWIIPPEKKPASGYCAPRAALFMLFFMLVLILAVAG